MPPQKGIWTASLDHFRNDARINLRFGAQNPNRHVLITYRYFISSIIAAPGNKTQLRCKSGGRALSDLGVELLVFSGLCVPTSVYLDGCHRDGLRDGIVLHKVIQSGLLLTHAGDRSHETCQEMLNTSNWYKSINTSSIQILLRYILVTNLMSKTYTRMAYASELSPYTVLHSCSQGLFHGFCHPRATRPLFSY